MESSLLRPATCAPRGSAAAAARLSLSLLSAAPDRSQCQHVTTPRRVETAESIAHVVHSDAHCRNMHEKSSIKGLELALMRHARARTCHRGASASAHSAALIILSTLLMRQMTVLNARRGLKQQQWCVPAIKASETTPAASTDMGSGDPSPAPCAARPAPALAPALPLTLRLGRGASGGRLRANGEGANAAISGECATSACCGKAVSSYWILNRKSEVRRHTELSGPVLGIHR